MGNATPFLGENAAFSFNFTNTSGADAGFSPFFDLIVETSGPDGTTNTPPVGLNPTTPGTAADGFGTPAVTAAGLSLAPIGTPIVLTAGQTTYTNPFTGQALSVPSGYGAGDTVFTYRLPFGSFTPGQTTLVQVTLPTSPLADLGTALDLTVRPGFRDTDGDPNAPLVPDVYTDVSAAATPKLWELRKVYVGPEDETATGPNYVRRYRLELDIAPGQTLQGLTVTDDLGPSMQLVGTTAANMAAFLAASGLGNNVFTSANLGGTAVTTAPDGTLTYAFGNVTGVAGVDAAFEFDFFVPRDNSSGQEILPQPTPPTPNPGGGTDSTTDTNTASAAATWNPVDSRDPQNQTVTKSAPDNGPHVIQEHSVAVQKSVALVTVGNPNTPASGPVLPGQSLLRYTINFQVSDYYAVRNLLLEDVLGDGQRLYLAPGFTPTLSVQNPWTFSNGGERAAASAGAFAGANTIDYERRYTIANSGNSDPTAGVEGYAATGPTGGPFSTPTSGAIDGSTFLRFNISDELIARGLSGLLVGGEIADGGGDPQNLAAAPFGPAQGTIVFWALVKNDYSDDYLSGDSSVDQGDVLENAVPLVRGEHLDTNDLADGAPASLGTFGTDDSAAGVTIGRGQQTKTVYAINGTVIPTQGAGDTVFSVQAGDRVTYKLTYTLPISRFEDLTFQDLPPLPVMRAGPAGQYSFDRTFDGSFGLYEIEVAPDDTFFSTFDGSGGNPLAPDLVPGGTITTNATTNTITMSFGDFEDHQDRFTTISLLVTLPVGSDPFDSDLFLTNQFRVNEGNTFLGESTLEDLRRIQLVRPQVTIDKGVVGYGTTGRTLGGHTFTAPADPPTAGSVPSFTGTIDSTAEANAVGVANAGLADSVDAGDRVRFGIVAQNTGRGDAFNVVIQDQVQPGFVVPATFAGLNLNVRRGDGTLLVNFAEVQGFARVATTGALTGTGIAFTTTGGGQFTDVDRVLDGSILNLNDLVLVKDQATASQNGVYRVTAVDEATGRVTLTRDAAFDTAVELSGAFVAVMGGTSADRYFQAGGVTTLNTDAVNYALQAATQDYYAIYDATTGAFRLLLSDNYTAGNTNAAGQSLDDRSGALSRAESVPAVNAGDNPTATPITNGSNTIVVQYDLVLEDDVAPNQTIVNTARVASYTSGEEGGDLTDPSVVPGGTDPTDTATAVVAVPLIAKSITGTEITEPGNNGIQSSPFLARATIGELVEFEVVVTVPEGETSGATIVDTLDLGLAFVDVTQVTIGSGLAVSGAPTVGATSANTLITNGGRTVTFNLGTLTNNTNANNAGDETITIRYRAVVLNTNGSGGTANNQAGQLRNNSAQVSWASNPTTVNSVQAGQQTGATGTRSGTAQNVTIVEPTLTVPKTVSNVTRGTGFQELVSADAGDTVQYRVVLTNGNAATDTTAFDISLSDPLPAPLGSPTVFSVASTGTIRFNGVARAATAADFVISGGTLQIAPGVNIDMEPGSTITVTVEGTWSGAIGNVITNTATLNWTSLDGSPSHTQYNAAGVERTGADGPGGPNDYRTADTADVESPPWSARPSSPPRTPARPPRRLTCRASPRRRARSGRSSATGW